MPEEMEASETKRMDVWGTSGANMGRLMMGCTVGMEALGSPYFVLICDDGEKGKTGRYHLLVRYQTTLDNGHRLRAKPGWIPNHQVRQLAYLHAPNNMAHALRNGGINRILTHISLNSEVVRSGTLVFLQCTALDFILVRSVPCS